MEQMPQFAGGNVYRSAMVTVGADQQHLVQQYHQQHPPSLPPAVVMQPLPVQNERPSLAPHFHLLQLISRLADAVGNGTKDQHFDALVEELTGQFNTCQQLLNTISGEISNKSVTVETQKQTLEETKQHVEKRRNMIAQYRSAVEDMVKQHASR